MLLSSKRIFEVYFLDEKKIHNKRNIIIVSWQDLKDNEDYNSKNGRDKDKFNNIDFKNIHFSMVIIDESHYASGTFSSKKILKKIKYDVRFIGDDWKEKKYTGYDLPHKIFYNNRSHGFSTTELRKRIYKAEKIKNLK